jgi:hypothetical protein
LIPVAAKLALPFYLYDKKAGITTDEIPHAFSAGRMARLHENSEGSDAQL